tara:strand:+ start:89 stop:478 length:390 start_codon:yes stop_codon:yes gene_type:complete
MKNKILDNLPTIWIILMFTFGLALASTNAKAGPYGMGNYPWSPMTVPMWCAPIEDVNDILERENYVPVEMAFGRVGGLPTGSIAYMVVTYASDDVEGHIIRTIETPEQVDKCILNMLFDYRAIVPETEL